MFTKFYGPSKVGIKASENLKDLLKKGNKMPSILDVIFEPGNTVGEEPRVSNGKNNLSNIPTNILFSVIPEGTLDLSSEITKHEISFLGIRSEIDAVYAELESRYPPEEKETFLGYGNNGEEVWL